MRRRVFLEKILLTSAGLMVVSQTFGHQQYKKKTSKRLVILHTNDTHSNIDPFPENHSKYPGMGGVAKRYSLINQIRKTEENVLLLDSGDIFQGTPYFNTFNGILEMKLMTKMGYDASTMGNHDFDIGMDGFLKAKKFADFPFLCANYDFSKTVLSTATEPYTIIQKSNIKIGVFGVGIALKGLVPEKNYDGTVYNDPIEIANQTALMLHKKKCDLIICLSHLGFDYNDPEKISDRKLAQNSKNIHLILGGHTHTFLERPVIEKNKSKRAVLINQVGWAGLQLGKIDIDIDQSIFQSNNISVG